MLINNSEIEKWKPGVPKSALLLMAGTIWLALGVVLDGMAFSWLRVENPGETLWISAVGFVSALLIHHFGFLRIVDKNLGRILPMEGRRCVFSFMPWKSYFLVLVMILMGYLLRHSSVPKHDLALLYLAIGTALILSSVRYLRFLMLVIKGCAGGVVEK
jgi:hypothetical protein